MALVLAIMLVVLTIVVLFLLWRCFWPYRYPGLRRTAIGHVLAINDSNVTEGNVFGNGGLLSYSRVVATTEDCVVVLVHRRFFRGGCSEGQDIHLVSVHVESKMIQSCTECPII